MPLPSIRYHTFRNRFEYDSGAVIHRDDRVQYGRLIWRGNQRRVRYSKVMPPTACSSTVIKYNTTEYRWYWVNVWLVGSAAWAYQRVSSGTINREPTSSDASSALSRAVNRFSSNSGFAETVAETPSTLRLLNRRTMLFYNMFKLAGRGSFRGAANLLRSATGYNASNRSIKRLEKKFSEAKSYDSRRASAFWLEYSFGIAPLLQSIFDSLEAFRRSSDLRKARAVSNGAGYHIYGSVVNRDVDTLDRLGLTNPALLAWNLLPFSFVVDWFLPISTILAWTASNRGLGTVFACSTSESSMTRTYGGVEYYTYTYYSRTPEEPPSVGDIFNASSRSHGLWTVVTTLSLVNSLR